MIEYLTTSDNFCVPVIALSEGTDQETYLFPTNKENLIRQLQNCKRDKLYMQIPVAFDTETTNFEQQDMKLATMYIWQFALKFESEIIFVYGRTWREWEDFINFLKYNLGKKRLVVYVHNLSFEFHFFYTHIYLTKVFARKKRHPIYAETDKIIFKCSYILTNYSLRKLAELRGYTSKEDLDYDKIRHWKTILPNKDLSYALVDVKILVELIDDEIRKNGKIQDIPLTQTGYARRYCLEYIKEHTNFMTYQSFVRSIVPTDPKLFGMLYQAFAGGFTHANFKYIDIVLENIFCRDRTSFYPYQMCCKRFPMRFLEANPDHFQLLTGKAMVMECEFINLNATTPHSILSEHKCMIKGDKIIDNGRVRFAENLTTTITDLDYDTIEKFYTYDTMNVNLLYVADYDYLPKEFIMAILELYKNKTTLKGIIGREEEYLRSKELLNSMYGMSVTNPLNDEITFDEGLWGLEEINTEDGLQKYRNSIKLFSAYQWGVWVTAWARHDLLMDVYEIGEDVVYCDTDSIKSLNPHDEVFEKTDKQVLNNIQDVMKRYNIKREYFFPKNEDGIEMPLGVWDKEPTYKLFKVLGAKRYCFSYEDDYFEKKKKKLNTNDNFFTTVAGVSKKALKNYIIKLANDSNLSPFDIFGYELYKNKEHYLVVPKEYSEKLTSHYSEQGFKTLLTDYQGITVGVSETSFICLEKIPFELKLSNDFSDFLEFMFTEKEGGGSFNEKRFKFSKE